jgi:hypothetical protein
LESWILVFGYVVKALVGGADHDFGDDIESSDHSQQAALWKATAGL